MTRTRKARPRLRLELSGAFGLVAIAALIALPPHAIGAATGGIGPGGVGTTPPSAGTTTPGPKAKLKNGFAIAPASAPDEVVAAIDAANEIVKHKPYCLGGGHGRRVDRCYDCSGTVSYALTGAGLLEYAMPSGSFMNWGQRGPGRWISVYANGGHMYAVIAGLRLDTSMTAGDGPGWSKTKRDQAGFRVRHPAGF